MSLSGVKGALQSKTVIGGLVTLAATVAGVGGYSVSTEDTGNIVVGVMGAVTAIGSVVSIVGRILATKKIGKA